MMTNKKELELECPYCGEKSFVAPPKGKPISSPPVETVCMPYTRDIGRFDHQGWSRIGKDYLSFMNWERIGILRIDQPGIDIQYRVQECSKCGSLYDVYANYNAGKEKLSELWKHLFAEDKDDDSAIIPYREVTLPLKLLRVLGNVFHSKYVAAFFLGLIIFLIGWLPLTFNLRSFTVPFEQTLFFGSISLGISLMILIVDSFVSYMQNTDDFFALYKVSNPKRGVVHWMNYSVARFVGVQEKGGKPRLSQAEIISGGTGIFLALVFWFINFNDFSMSRTISFSGSEFQKLLSSLQPFAYKEFVSILSELFFVLFFVYTITITIYLALSITFYILNGLRRIPMNLDVYDGFSNITPVRKLESYSVQGMLASFITVLVIVALLEIFQVAQADWLFFWLQWALAFLFVFLGFGLGRGEYIGIAFCYFVLNALVSTEATLTGFDFRIVVLGLFFTSLLAFQVYMSGYYVDSLLVDAKVKELQRLGSLLDVLKSEQIAIQEKAQSSIREEKLSGVTSQLRKNLDNMERIIRLISHVEDTPTDRGSWMKISEIFSPLATSIFLSVASMFIDGAIDQLFKKIIS